MMANEEKTITELIGVGWIWLTMVAGGCVDYILQSQRGIKPKAPISLVVMSLSVHLLVACFAGVISVFVATAFGFNSEAELGAASGMGGYMGVRLFDVLAVVWKLRTGTELPK